MAPSFPAQGSPRVALMGEGTPQPGFPKKPHQKVSDILSETVYTSEKAMAPTPVLLPVKSHGQRSVVACSPWGRKESDTTKRLHFHFSLSCIGEGNVLAWRIPGTAEPGGLPSMGSHRVGHD